MKRLFFLLSITLNLIAAMFPAIATPGNTDPTFDPNVGASGDFVFVTAIQPDGRIIIGGKFSTVGTTARTNIARLNVDGSVDTTFDPGLGPNNLVRCIAVQADGKILIGGTFTTVNGQSRNRIARLNADGSLESTATFDTGTGANNEIHGMALQSDGKILIGGYFTTINGQTRNRIARLNTDGSIESTATFNPGTGANSDVGCIAVQPDGNILLGGDFTSINGVLRNRIARLNVDGSVEITTTFNPGAGASGMVRCIAVQKDGRILIGGGFNSVDGQARSRLARLNGDGSIESTTTFNLGSGVENDVFSIAAQIDGKILIGGMFSSVNGQARGKIARLNSDGSVESTATFNTGSGATDIIYSVVLREDGKVIVSGWFTYLNSGSQARNRIALLANDPATQLLTIPNLAEVDWMRAGAGPEIDTVTFELSTDGGASWGQLGFGTRISGGWRRTGLNLPQSGAIRARGRTVVAAIGGSSNLVEAQASFPNGPEIVVEQPAGMNISDGGSKNFGLVDVDANTSLTFTIKNIGTENLTGLTISGDGPDAAMFTVTSSPTAPLSGPLERVLHFKEGGIGA